MTSSAKRSDHGEIWAVRGPAILPIETRSPDEGDECGDRGAGAGAAAGWTDVSRDGRADELGSGLGTAAGLGAPAGGALVAARRDSERVATGLVADAGIVIRDGQIVDAGDFDALMELARSERQRDPQSLAPDWATALEHARRWDGIILPGLVDLHCHGGGGQSFPDAANADDAMVAVGEHRRHGTTSLVASLVTDSPERLIGQTALLSQLYVAGELAGIHLEGPFLSTDRAGAQDPAKMQAPNPNLVRQIAEAARGGFAVMTIAPELAGVLPGSWTGEGGGAEAGRLSGRAAGGGPGGGGAASGAAEESVIEALAAVGAVASFGHTNCTAEEMGAAVLAADRLMAGGHFRIGRVATATHLFNGMPPIHHRRPGPALECLARAAQAEMVVELVADGVHLDPRTVKDVFVLAGRANVALVTDAMAAAGMPDGQYQLGPAAVTVAAGVARLTGGDSIAGGTAHLIDVVRSAWRSSGVPLAQAVGAASLAPARVLGQAARFGALAPGRQADLILADADLRPIEVYRHGRRV
ncbi:MAG: amidohydrolase family protein [Bifidobacteriaceae bacterium]|jgi:N-acetylglucosamine-6-phosphate deacetylase|nr:amidohydrolase family protein [Bifidobacteriaceae bacterium]